ncbi:MAG TPA: response regulator [Planctomycetota bacterium]|nr:response regulator [Planctomycetota bacterium]
MSTQRPEPEVKPRRVRRARKTLLVVEDEKLIRWSIREALRRDFHVRAAASAEEAGKLLPRIKHLDGVLVDVRLPGMSGLEFCQKVRASWPRVKVFVMTAYSQETAARDAFGVHADAYLAKPFELETLRDMMASHLGGYSA